MRSANGVRCCYEGAKSNARGLNSWGHEYLRAECEYATLILDSRRLRAHPVEGAACRCQADTDGSYELPLREQPKWANAWLIEQFVQWLAGGEPMETNVEANLQSVALVFAAIESSRTGEPVRIPDYLERTRQRVLAESAPEGR